MRIADCMKQTAPTGLRRPQFAPLQGHLLTAGNWHANRFSKREPKPHMNLPHALGFFLLGLTMMVLPELAPAIAARSGSFSDVSALWLEFMGGVIFLIGSGGTAKCLAAALPKEPARGTRRVYAPTRASESNALPVDGRRQARV